MSVVPSFGKQSHSDLPSVSLHRHEIIVWYYGPLFLILGMFIFLKSKTPINIPKLAQSHAYAKSELLLKIIWSIEICSFYSNNFV